MKDITTSFNLFLDFETKEERIEKLKNTLPHYENAESDNQKLCNFQYDFLVHGDRKAEVMLWKTFIEHTNNAEPIRKGICCDSCNSRYIIHTRLLASKIKSSISFEVVKKWTRFFGSD